MLMSTNINIMQMLHYLQNKSDGNVQCKKIIKEEEKLFFKKTVLFPERILSRIKFLKSNQNGADSTWNYAL